MRAFAASLIIIFTMSGVVNSRGFAAGSGGSNQFNGMKGGGELFAAASRAREASSSTAANPPLPLPTHVNVQEMAVGGI